MTNKLTQPKEAEDLVFEGAEDLCSGERRGEEGERIMVNILRLNKDSDGMDKYFTRALQIFPKIGSFILSIGEADSEYLNTVRAFVLQEHSGHVHHGHKQGVQCGGHPQEGRAARLIHIFYKTDDLNNIFNRRM